VEVPDDGSGGDPAGRDSEALLSVAAGDGTGDGAGDAVVVSAQPARSAAPMATAMGRQSMGRMA
jgi:hypothetical protein